MKNPQQLSFTLRIQSKLLTNHSLKMLANFTNLISCQALPHSPHLTTFFPFPLKHKKLGLLLPGMPLPLLISSWLLLTLQYHFPESSPGPPSTLVLHSLYSSYCLLVLKLKLVSLTQIILPIHFCI